MALWTGWVWCERAENNLLSGSVLPWEKPVAVTTFAIVFEAWLPLGPFNKILGFIAGWTSQRKQKKLSTDFNGDRPRTSNYSLE